MTTKKLTYQEQYYKRKLELLEQPKKQEEPTLELQPVEVQKTPVKPPEPLKYRNGSLVERPKKSQKYYYHTEGNFYDYVDHNNCDEDQLDLGRLFKHNCFATAEEAQIHLDNTIIYNKIYKRIKEIDRENGWVCDWEDKKQSKYYVFLNFFNSKKSFLIIFFCRAQGIIYMSEQAKDWLMSAEVSDEEFKIFVNY